LQFLILGRGFAAGKVHQFLTLFHNGASEYINVTYIEAQLVLPQDNSIFVQNVNKFKKILKPKKKILK
jgi:hypothetical protein